MKQRPCRFPQCQRNWILTSKQGLCAVHQERLDFMLFAMNEIIKRGKPGDETRKSGIVVPGPGEAEKMIAVVMPGGPPKRS